MVDKVIGVDLGGTQIRATLAGANGQLMNRVATLTLAHEGPDAVLERIYRSIEQAAGGEKFAAIGIGAPGPTDPYQGVVLMGPNLPGWHNVPLRQHLSERFSAPVYLGNDANVAGLAEHAFGAGRGCSNMIYITVSTGIGSGVIINNRLLLGQQGLAAEVGHTTIDVSAEDQREAMIGTLEGLASGPNIARRAQHALRAGATSLAVDLAEGDIESVDTKWLNRAAKQGDAFAIEQFRIAGRYLGIGFTNLLHTFNPQRFVIGGSVWTHCQRFLVDPIWETIRARANAPEYWKNLEIVTAAFTDDVGLLGAVALAQLGLRDQGIQNLTRE